MNETISAGDDFIGPAGLQLKNQFPPRPPSSRCKFMDDRRKRGGKTSAAQAQIHVGEQFKQMDVQCHVQLRQLRDD